MGSIRLAACVTCDNVGIEHRYQVEIVRLHIVFGFMAEYIPDVAGLYAYAASIAVTAAINARCFYKAGQSPLPLTMQP